MFIGEIGCWLVVACATIHRQLRARIYRRGDGQGLGIAESSVHIDDEDERMRLLHGDESDARTGAHTRSKSPARPHMDDNNLCVLLLALPAICDILGTTLMNAGLLLVAASIYQMTRGTLVLFVGVFSVIFLRRQLYLFQWISLLGVVVGVGIVGLAGAVYPDLPTVTSGFQNTLSNAVPPQERTNDPAVAMIGVLLIVGAQTFTASQFVLEEWILSNSTIEPIHVVGWEGIFGLAFTLLGMLVLHLTIGTTAEGAGGPFNAVDGWRQMTSSKEIAVSSILIMISIAYVSLERHRVHHPGMASGTWTIVNKAWQRFQFLWTVCYPNCERHVPINYRHLPDSFHLDDISRAWMGDI